MLNPKPRTELPLQADDAAPDVGRGFAEPRSFSPRYAPDPRPGSAVTPWPQAWAHLDLSQLIHVPTEAANAPAPLDEEALQKRALIVIPCLNEEALIAHVVGRLLEDEGLVDPLVLVADGGSSDRSRQIVSEIAARDPRVHLIANPQRLQSAGVNRAAKAMGGGRPWLVRIDAHADYPKNYVSTLIAEARRTGAHSVVVTMDTVGEAGFQRAVAAAQNSRLGTGGAAHRVGAAAGWVDHGHHALFNREAFQAVGGYDETFSHNEDAELDLRLSQEGARIWLTGETRIVYHPRSTPSALWKQYVSYGKGRARTVLKHATPLKMRQALPLGVAPAVASVLAAPLFWPLIVPALVWMLAALSYGAMLGLKQKDRAILMGAGVAAMIMHLAWSLGFWMQVGAGLRDRGRSPTEPGLQAAPAAP